MPTNNVEPWYYVLAVPADSVAAADLLAPNLGNPDGIEATFLRYPRTITGEGEEQTITYPDPTEYWIASFLAFDLAADGAPSREALESGLNSGNTSLANILWWRMDNPWKPGNTAAILRAKHESVAGPIGQSWSTAQAVAALGF